MKDVEELGNRPVGDDNQWNRLKLTAQGDSGERVQKRMKGYDADEVDEFLDAVIYTIEHFEEEIQGLKSRNVQDEKQGITSGKDVSASGEAARRKSY